MYDPRLRSQKKRKWRKARLVISCSFSAGCRDPAGFLSDDGIFHRNRNFHVPLPSMTRILYISVWEKSIGPEM